MPGQSKQTQKTESAPWAPAQPMLQSQLAGAEAWKNSPGASSYYQGPRVAGMSSQTQAGIDHLTNGSGTTGASNMLTRIMNGEFLNQENPNQAALDSSIRSSVMPAVNSTFSASGMGGSTNHTGVATRALTEAMAAPRYQAFENERQRQMNAALALPELDNLRAGQLLTAGQTREGYNQREIEAAREAFEEQRTAGLRPLLETQPIFGQIGSMGGTNTTTQTSKPSLGQQIIGGGMMAASLMGMPTGGSTLLSKLMGSTSQQSNPNVWSNPAPYGTLPWQTA